MADEALAGITDTNEPWTAPMASAFIRLNREVLGGLDLLYTSKPDGIRDAETGFSVLRSVVEAKVKEGYTFRSKRQEIMEITMKLKEEMDTWEFLDLQFETYEKIRRRDEETKERKKGITGYNTSQSSSPPSSTQDQQQENHSPSSEAPQFKHIGGSVDNI
jgi:hypothetical protein